MQNLTVIFALLFMLMGCAMPDGQATYTYATGDKYVGEFKDGKYHGQGTVTSVDGRVKAGVWENGELV